MPISGAEDKNFVLTQETFIRVCGRHSEHLKLIEAEFGVRLVTRGNEIRIAKNGTHSNRAYRVLTDLVSLAQSRRELSLQDVKYVIRMVREDIVNPASPIPQDLPDPDNTDAESLSISQLMTEYIRVPSKRGKVQPKTINQKKYIDSIRKNDIVFGVGPAGTGKTYLAMAMAVEYLIAEKVARIILVRPAVEAGEKLGFLPGDIEEKVNPYLRPLYDALFDMMDQHRAREYMEEGIIEVAPLAFMRGRTLNDAFIILDEAQNTTKEQMKMFLTRLGYDSKAVVTGDITQIDLPVGKESGLIQALQILKGIQGIEMVHFNATDVVRHELVQEIIRAYSEFTNEHKLQDNPDIPGLSQ
jgi:phosphate starvation-inducible protein PhoH and related proteins